MDLSVSGENVRAAFIGAWPGSPLRLQRLGKAGHGAAAASVSSSSAPAHGSGAEAVPTLGFVASGEDASAQDKALTAAVEAELARLWKDGRVVSVAPPPAGFQWWLGGEVGREAAAESSVRLKAQYNAGQWSFLANGTKLPPFDASALLEACSEPSSVAELDAERSALLLQALYCTIPSSPDAASTAHGGAPEEGAVEAMDTSGDDGVGAGRGSARPRHEAADAVTMLTRLEALAAAERRVGVSEGRVYGWLPLVRAAVCAVPPSAWRDALVTMTTLEPNELLGFSVADDLEKQRMTEGVVLRIFAAFEMLCAWPPARMSPPRVHRGRGSRMGTTQRYLAECGALESRSGRPNGAAQGPCDALARACAWCGLPAHGGGDADACAR